jgi:glycerol kinase
MLNTAVLRPTVVESTARGVAFLAGIATDVWSGREELANSFELERAFRLKMSREKADELYRGWMRAVERSRDWAGH